MRWKMSPFFPRQESFWQKHLAVREGFAYETSEVGEIDAVPKGQGLPAVTCSSLTVGI